MSIAMLENPAVRSLIRPLSIKSYHMLRDWGALSIKTEFINGVVIEKMSKSPLHTYILAALYQLLAARLPEEAYWLRKEDPLTLEGSELEPDLSIVKGAPYDFRTEHPHTAELAVEVAVTSVALDREKADIYAAAGIPAYWLIMPETREAKVYTEPWQGRYHQVKTMREDGSLHTAWGMELALREIFEAPSNVNAKNQDEVEAIHEQLMDQYAPAFERLAK
ncbi:MAG: Uma2 family endonuclease [Gammaproteobacteria bacterium]|nr:Uma2 family endonuclease [Gammaproteobacteria bacterium]